MLVLYTAIACDNIALSLSYSNPMIPLESVLIHLSRHRHWVEPLLAQSFYGFPSHFIWRAPGSPGMSTHPPKLYLLSPTILCHPSLLFPIRWALQVSKLCPASYEVCPQLPKQCIHPLEHRSSLQYSVVAAFNYGISYQSVFSQHMWLQHSQTVKGS